MAMTRSTGGNQFVTEDAGIMDVLRCARDQLRFIERYAEELDKKFNIAEITITTKRIPNGLISVQVEADLE